MEIRVAILGIYHESNTFLVTNTTLADFEKGHLLYGEDIVAEYDKAFHEIGGMLEVLRISDVEAVPLVFAEATPGGIVTDEALHFLFGKISSAFLDAGRLDGVLVAVHGAAVSESQPDMDGWWLEKLRTLAGKGVPIIGTLDPHANVSQRMVRATDALVAYKTNPHIDQRTAGARSARLMVDTLRGKVRPTHYFFQPGATISIEQQYTSGSPCQELYAQANVLIANSAILSVSVMLGFPYADVREMGSGFLVVTDNDMSLAQSAAESLGKYLWDNRMAFVGKKISVEEAVLSIAANMRPILFLDMGDNVGGGSPGDSTFILEALEMAGMWRSFVCIYDPGAVQEAENAGAGMRIHLAIGGKTDHLHGEPYHTDVLITFIGKGTFSENEARHGGQVNFDMGTTAILETYKGTTIMLTSRRMAPFSLRQLLSFGIQPEVYDVIVAKGVHAPIAAYRHACKSFIQVNTEGVTHADMTRMSFTHRRRPLYPFENSTA